MPTGWTVAIPAEEEFCVLGKEKTRVNWEESWMRINAGTSGHTLFSLQVASRTQSRMMCPSLLLQSWCFWEKSHYSVVDFFEEGTARGGGWAVVQGEPGKPPSLQEKDWDNLCYLSVCSFVNKPEQRAGMSLDAAKHEGCIYRADGERHLFKHSSCHHTRSFEFLEHFSSYVTQWISSTTLPVIKENAFCIATGYSGTTIRKMGDFSTFGYCLQWQD